MLPMIVTMRWDEADSGVQAVSPQVTISHPSGSRLPLAHYFPPGLQLPSQPQSITVLGRYQVILLGDRCT